MLLSSVLVNKIWSELLPGYLIHFYSKWLGNFTEVGSVGSRVSSGFVSSCVSPSQLATRAMSPGGPESNQRGARSSNTAWTEDRACAAPGKQMAVTISELKKGEKPCGSVLEEWGGKKKTIKTYAHN